MKIKYAKRLAELLILRHGVGEYTFSFMQKRKRFNRAGQCNWRKKTIQLQPTFVELNNLSVVKNTILHEIAHALRPKHHHNKYFQKTATSIGCVASVEGRNTYYGKEVKKI